MPIRIQDYDIKRNGTDDDWAEVNRLLADIADQPKATAVPGGTYMIKCPVDQTGIKIPAPDKLDCSAGVTIILQPSEIPPGQLPAHVDMADETITGLTWRTYPITIAQQRQRWIDAGRDPSTKELV